MKSTDFCSGVVKSMRAHFGCMKPSIAVHAGRGFCKEHGPAFETFYVYRVDHHGSVDKVLVYQPPGNNFSFYVVSPRDRKHGSTLWGNDWHRTVEAARGAPLKKAQKAVDEAKKELAEKVRALKKVRGLR